MKFQNRLGTSVWFYDAGSELGIEVSPGVATFVIAWGGVGMVEYVITYNSPQNSSVLAGLFGKYSYLFGINKDSCQITGNSSQVHDNEMGPSQKTPIGMADLKVWKARVKKMLATTPLFSILVLLILDRALKLMDIAAESL